MRLIFFIFIESNFSMGKNPEKSNKFVIKNRRSSKLAFFPLNLLTKDLIISDVIGSFLAISDSEKRSYTSNANWAK